jgi:hypothetical protein
MRRKYLRGAGVFYSKSRPDDSPLWKDMMLLKNLYLCGRRMEVGNGAMTIWCDSWCGQCPLKDKFPNIYNVCIEQNITVADATCLGSRFTTRRWLIPDLAKNMNGLLQLLIQITLNDEQDKPFWKWTKSGKFSVKLRYNHLCSNGIDRSFKHRWKSRNSTQKQDLAMAHMAQFNCDKR